MKPTWSGCAVYLLLCFFLFSNTSNSWTKRIKYWCRIKLKKKKRWIRIFYEISFRCVSFSEHIYTRPRQLWHCTKPRIKWLYSHSGMSYKWIYILRSICWRGFFASNTHSWQNGTFSARLSWIDDFYEVRPVAIQCKGRMPAKVLAHAFVLVLIATIYLFWLNNLVPFSRTFIFGRPVEWQIKYLPPKSCEVNAELWTTRHPI